MRSKIPHTPFAIDNEAVQQLLLEMAQERTTKALFDVIVSRLAEFSNVAMARIWILQPGDICSDCFSEPECSDRSNCLHLVASAGKSSKYHGVQWTNITGQYGRFPLGSRKVGYIASTGKPVIVKHIEKDSKWIADINWTRDENIQGFAGQPLIFQRKVLGVLAVFSKSILTAAVLDALRIIADHAASALAHAQAFEEIAQLQKQLEAENNYLREELYEVATLGGFVGKSIALQQILCQIDVVAPTKANVLIQGESGTGKELVALEIFHRSSRKNKAMIKVNCASIPKDLFESEFFGHVKGAFTGALADRDGRFGAADGGTIFLDEIGEIPLEHQSKLLRVIQEGEYERVGENKTKKTDVRIIAATNRDLKTEVKEGRFREDLFYRLNVFPLNVKPLRDRKEDIEPLANHFLQIVLKDMNRPLRQLNNYHLQQLQAYDWPGNVRELHNVIERAAILTVSGTLELQLPIGNLGPRTRKQIDEQRLSEHDSNLDFFTERQMLQFQRENTKAALISCGWKIYGNDGAAAILGIKPTTLATRIKKMQLQVPSSKNHIQEK